MQSHSHTTCPIAGTEHVRTARYVHMRTAIRVRSSQTNMMTTVQWFCKHY